jgi:hypothetical protein
VSKTYPPVVRPDGRTYRPRKAPRWIDLGWDGDFAVLLGTHDVLLASIIARDEWDVASITVIPGWCSTGPGGDGGEFLRMYYRADGTGRSTPCVWVDYVFKPWPRP